MAGRAPCERALPGSSALPSSRTWHSYAELACHYAATFHPPSSAPTHAPATWTRASSPICELLGRATALPPARPRMTSPPAAALRATSRWSSPMLVRKGRAFALYGPKEASSTQMPCELPNFY
eukprot:scaffold196896_cov32-Tisochrysis_lutea.AAC.1